MVKIFQLHQEENIKNSSFACISAINLLYYRSELFVTETCLSLDGLREERSELYRPFSLIFTQKIFSIVWEGSWISTNLFYSASHIIEHIYFMIDNKFIILHTVFGFGSSLSHQFCKLL